MKPQFKYDRSARGARSNNERNNNILERKSHSTPNRAMIVLYWFRQIYNFMGNNHHPSAMKQSKSILIYKMEFSVIYCLASIRRSYGCQPANESRPMQINVFPIIIIIHLSTIQCAHTPYTHRAYHTIINQPRHIQFEKTNMIFNQLEMSLKTSKLARLSALPAKGAKEMLAESSGQNAQKICLYSCIHEYILLFVVCRAHSKRLTTFPLQNFRNVV